MKSRKNVEKLNPSWLNDARKILAWLKHAAKKDGINDTEAAYDYGLHSMTVMSSESAGDGLQFIFNADGSVTEASTGKCMQDAKCLIDALEDVMKEMKEEKK